jgi:hypothetical protein
MIVNTEPESEDPNAILIADIVDEIKHLIPVKKCHILDGVRLICAELKMLRSIRQYQESLQTIITKETGDDEESE